MCIFFMNVRFKSYHEYEMSLKILTSSENILIDPCVESLSKIYIVVLADGSSGISICCFDELCRCNLLAVFWQAAAIPCLTTTHNLAY